MPYYDTTSLDGVQLREAVAQCQRQRDAVILLYKRAKTPLEITPSEVLKRLQKLNYNKYYNTPLTSIRRAMCDLTEDGELHVIGKKKGPLGRDELVRALPVYVAQQAELF